MKTILAAVALIAAPLQAQQITGELELETRAFPRSPLWEDQSRNNVSLRFQPELYREWDRGRLTFQFEPFVRLDYADGERTHVDIRELSFTRAWDAVQLRVGIRTVFWGVTESQHLVDVINQTDLVENPDGEDKLGQPMVNVAFIRPWGTVDVFVMPWFRERTYPGVEGRFRFPLPVDTDGAVYESDAGRHHVDWAVRWSHYLGGFDLGVSHFSGTSREPVLVPGVNDAGNQVLLPRFNLIDQTGVDAQYTSGGWLWKFEGISRSGIGDRMYAFTAGLEYTLYGVLGTNADLGLIGEYLWDSRSDARVAPFADDVAVGARFAFNDVQSSELLAVAVVDRNTGGTFVSLEGNRRVGQDWTVGLETRAFLGMQSTDLLYALRRDAYVGVNVTRYF
jgi:hypothetical protein